jgi:transposase
MSWIRRVKRGNQFYLYEVTSVWENGRPKQKLVQYLGVESDQEKVPKPKTKRVRPDLIYPLQSRVAGDVMLLWKIAESLNIVNTIDRYTTGFQNVAGPSPGKYLLTWAINRLIDPESATQLEAWVQSTVLPDLLGMDPLDFTKDAYLSSLDAICTQSPKTQRINSHIPTIEVELYQKWRSIRPLPTGCQETIAYDLTPILTYGTECPLIEPGSKINDTQLNQLNLSVITSFADSYPISHFVHPGSFHSISTIPDLMVRLAELMIKPGTIVWDRGYTTKTQIALVEKASWKLICGVTKRTNEVKALLAATEPPVDPYHLVPTQCMNIYAVKVDTPIFGRRGSVVVYLNAERRLKDLKKRNCALLQIQKDLEELQMSCKDLNRDALSEKIAKIVPLAFRPFFQISIQKSPDGMILDWKADDDARINAEKLDGKYLLYASDLHLSSADVVQMYFEKDFVEKVFRDLKTFEEIAPIRHRKESRVLGIIFVCTLALRLKTVLRVMLDSAKDEKWNVEVLLKRLGRVHRVDLQKDTEREIWYTGLQKKTQAVLEEIGMKDLFGDKVRNT